MRDRDLVRGRGEFSLSGLRSDVSKADLPKSMPSQMGSWGLSCRRGRKNRGGNGVRMPRENPLLQFTVSEPWLIDLCWSMRRVDALFIIVWRPNLFRHVVVWWQSSTLSTFKSSTSAQSPWSTLLGGLSARVSKNCHLDFRRRSCRLVR